MSRRILLVCTGNTCRSPMAEVLLRAELARRGLEGVEVGSAGTGAWEGAPASEGSYLVMLERGEDLSAHRARQLTRELVASADLVLTMSRSHLARVRELGAAGRAHLLAAYAGEGEDVEVRDPFGGDLAEYRATLAELERLVTLAAERMQQEHGR